MKPTLVAFDCDGVLVDTEPVVNRVFVELVARTGLSLDVEASLVRFTGVSMSERIATVASEHRWTPPATLEHEFDVRQREAFETELRAVPFVESVVRAIRGPRAVVSNGTRAEMTLKLTRAGFLDAFHPNLFSAAEVARSKPFPDVYLRAASTLGVPPQASIAIEDSVPGVQAALAAGFAVFGFAARTDPGALARLGVRVFRTMAELPELLRASGVELS